MSLNKKSYEAYIASYKELEQLLRADNMSVLDYENTLPDSDLKKMQLCRMTRNYIQHNSDYMNFIQISDGMQSFVDDIIIKIRSKKGILKDSMQTIAKFGCVFSYDMPVLDAAVMLNKKHNDFGIVLNKKGECIGALSCSVIAKAYALNMLARNAKISKLADMLDCIHTVRMSQMSSMLDVNKLLDQQIIDVILVVNSVDKIVGVYNS